MENIINILELTDEQLEDCVDGTTNIRLLRQIMQMPGIMNEEGYIDPDAFSEIFARELEDFIGEDEDSEAWQEINDNNLNWGFDIADNINMLKIRSENELQ